MSPPGIVLATDETECADIIRFSETVPDRYGMSFSEWLDVVPAQRMAIVLEVIFGLSIDAWPAKSFARSPDTIPCGGWERRAEPMPYDELFDTPLEPLYVSAELQIDGDVASIRVFQDFDCDGDSVVLEIAGRFMPGGSPVGAGWQVQSTIVPRLDE